jgi:fused signal recognition particle receptor
LPRFTYGEVDSLKKGPVPIFAISVQSAAMFGSRGKPAANQAAEPSRGGFLARLRAKVNRGSSWVGDLLPGRKIDDELLEELETRLLAADVGVDATQAILAELHRRVARRELGDVEALLGALHDSLLEVLQPVELPFAVDRSHRPYVVLVVGVNGSGKTTTIGKLARRLKEDGLRVMLAAGDTFRAAAVEQLTAWAERNQVPIIAQAAGADPAAVVFDALEAAKARGIDVLIADTAGRLHTQSHLMDELRKITRVLKRLDPGAPHEVLLVLDASLGQNALRQAEQFGEAVGVTGLVITKLDGTAKGGVVIAIARRFGLPIRFVGVGEQVEDFGPFDAAAFVDGLLRPGPGDAA